MEAYQSLELLCQVQKYLFFAQVVRKHKYPVLLMASNNAD